MRTPTLLPHLAELDATVLLVVFLSKALVAVVCIGFGRATLGTMRGRASLSHAAMYAMAASHSFDVTLGIPLATELFPSLVAYVYANQSVPCMQCMHMHMHIHMHRHVHTCGQPATYTYT